MADQPNIVVTGDSREAVAYALLLGIAKHEQKQIYSQSGTPTVVADADWVLATYLRCLKTMVGG